MSESDENKTTAEVDVAAVVEPSSNDSEGNLLSPLSSDVKLIGDCWDQIFDYLSLHDIFRMGDTCKQLHQMAGNYVCKYLPDLQYDLIAGEVFIKLERDTFHIRTDFCQNIRKLCIGKRSELDYFLDADTLSSLKTLIFDSIELTEVQVQYTRNVMINIESVHLKYCDMTVKAIEQLIAYCPKLKFLNVYDCYMIDDAPQKSIFLQNCPTLEHFQYETTLWKESNEKYENMKTFLENHTNLKSFESECSFLWAHQDILLNTNIRLERLIIHFYQWNEEITFDEFVDFLKTLHERGFYETVHFIGCKKFSDSFSTLPLATLTKAYVNNDPTHLTGLTQLKELHIQVLNADTDPLAKSLVNLERLTICGFPIDDNYILPFIRHSNNLSIIKVESSSIKGAFDPFAMNEERKKLGNSNPVTISLPEDVYLIQKWKSQNLNLSHVKITRSDM